MKTASADSEKEKLTKGQDFLLCKRLYHRAQSGHNYSLPWWEIAGNYSFDLIDFIIRK